MALSFLKKAQASSTTTNQQDDDPPFDNGEAKSSQKSEASSQPKQAVKIGGFMKTGKAAQQAIADADAKAEADKAERDKLFKFKIPENEDRKITFLDGHLDEDGLLDCPMFYQHTVKHNGNWRSYVCTMEQEGQCPICNEGEYKSALVGVLTVLNHTPYTIQSGNKAGTVIRDQKQLFVGKKETIKQLTKLAQKRGGLAGCTFDASRGNDKTASVGNSFDFTEKRSLEEIRVAYKLKPEDVEPADMEHEITYHTADELVALGVGKATTGPGYDKPKMSGHSMKDAL